MSPHPMILDVAVDMNMVNDIVMVVANIIPNTMVVIIGKMPPTTKSGTILKQNYQKMGKIYKVNKLMKMNITNVVRKSI